MSDLEDYEAKLSELDEAKARVESMIAGLPDSAEKGILQRDWRQTSIDNIPESTSIPMSSHPRRNTIGIDGRQWPPGREVSKALSAYHKALQAATFAYNRLMAADVTVNPPEP